MKLLGTKINFDYNAEAKVFSSLLRNRHSLYEASVIYNCWQGASQGWEQFQSDSGAQVIPFDTGWRPNPDNRRSAFGKVVSVAKYYRSLPKLLKIARNLQPDLIYSCQQRYDVILASYLAKRLSKPQIVHLHYNIGPWLGQAALNILKECRFIITVSDFIRDQVIAYGRSPDSVATVRNTMRIPEPVPLSRRCALRDSLGIPQEAVVVGMVARLDPFKGAEDVVSAFIQIADRFPQAYLVMVGDGSLRESLEKQAFSSPAADHIRFTGRRTDVPELLGMIDIFTHPSHKDPAPLAVLEACAAGLPVVAYEEGGICEFIVNGKTGLLTEPNRVEGLAASLTALISDPERAREMGVLNQQRIAEEFQPEQAGKRFAEIILSKAV
jgi:glycosyltransferase involved in cell wall biosynthesis